MRQAGRQATFNLACNLKLVQQHTAPTANIGISLTTTLHPIRQHTGTAHIQLLEKRKLLHVFIAWFSMISQSARRIIIPRKHYCLWYGQSLSTRASSSANLYRRSVGSISRRSQNGTSIASIDIACQDHRHRQHQQQIRRSMNSKSHYEAHTAESYENAFFYEEGDYSKYLCDLVVNRLCLKDMNFSGRTLLDIGGGTGNFTRSITREFDESVGEETDKMTSIVVDPFLPESSSSPNKDDILHFVKASAEEFMKELHPNAASSDQWWRQNYHQILMKEVVHHFEESDRIRIFRGMLEGFSSAPLVNKNNGETAPSLLIITRPQRDIDYPLWDAARDVWAKNQPHVDDLVNDLKVAGFQNVSHTVEGYPCAIALKRWQAMVKARFWSTFANFTDAELDEACENIAAEALGNSKGVVGSRGREEGILHFEDRLVFISAHHK